MNAQTTANVYYVDTKKLRALTHKRLDGCWKTSCRVPTVRLWMVDYAIR